MQRETRARGAQVQVSGGLWRLAVIGTLFAGVGLVLILRLYEFQIRDSARYQQLASDERRAQIPLSPRRGALLDSRGNPLAVSVLYQSVYALAPLVGDLDRTAAALAPVLELPTDQIRKKLDKTNKQPVVLRSQVPSAIAQRVQTLEMPGVYLEREPIRQYPDGSIAAQMLGFVGQDGAGLTGVELSWERELAGTPGVIDTERDTVGQEISLGRRVMTPPKEGADLVLTLDRVVQRNSERILEDAVKRNKASGGLILVMEPRTGRIVVSANYPTYSLTADEIYQPELANFYKTTVVTNQFEPGSTMKLITMAAAIDEGLVSPGTTMNDTGVANVGGATIRNWDFMANGQISMTQVLIKSSNVGTQWVAGLLGPERLYGAFERFGFGSETGIRLPGETPGMMRTPAMEGWTKVDLATNSFGQGIAVTSLQVLSAVASLANDGVLVRPQIVREVRRGADVEVVEPEPVRQAVSPRTARTLVNMMVEVANQEGLRPHRVPGYRMALKTGTADTPTSLGYDTGKTFASVVALLPADDPKFAVLIRLDGPEAIYGGATAAPVLKQVAQELFSYYRIPPSDLVALQSAAE